MKINKPTKSLISFILGLIISYFFTAYIQGTFDINQIPRDVKIFQLVIFLFSQLVSSFIIYS